MCLLQRFFFRRIVIENAVGSKEIFTEFSARNGKLFVRQVGCG